MRMHSMHVRIIFIFFFLTVHFCNGQSNSVRNKSLSDSIILLLIQEKTASIKSKRVVDSLQRELLLYKVKEDFYSDKMSSLGSLYSTVMGIIAASITAIGVGIFLNRINATKKELEIKIEEYGAKSNDLEDTITTTFIHTLAIQAQSSSDKVHTYTINKKWISAIVESMNGMEYCYIALSFDYNEKNNEDYNIIAAGMVNKIKSFKGKIDISILRFKSDLLDKNLVSDTNKKNYIRRLENVINDTSTEDYVSEIESREARGIYYEKIVELKSLIKDLKI